MSGPKKLTKRSGRLGSTKKSDEKHTVEARVNIAVKNLLQNWGPEKINLGKVKAAAKISGVNSEEILNELKRIEEAIFQINPSASKYEIVEVQNTKVYKCKDNQDNLLSYFFVCQGNGFQGLIKIAVSVTPEWNNVVGIRILEQTETPGLGAKITDTDFINRFSYLALVENQAISCLKKKAKKENSQVLAITGATISSKSVVNIINDEISVLRYLVSER